MGIRLIATDLDGTVLGRNGEYELLEQFRQVVDELRRKDGTYWTVSTGRSLHSFDRVFGPLATLAVEPDYVIARHAYIYGVDHKGFRPHTLWNLRTRYLIWWDRRQMRAALARWRRVVTQRFPRVRTLALMRDRVCLRFETEKHASMAAEWIEARITQCRHLRVFRYSREVDVRSVPFTKGMAIRELARHLGVDRSEILAIGDGHNDISMLDGSTAAMTGCPANAQPEVMSTVHDSQGHIADARSLAGVLEILAAHRSGQVRSKLPATWRDPAFGENPRSHSTRHTSLATRQRRKARLFFVVAISYAVLLSLASLELIPFSEKIMLPYRVLERLLIGVFGWFRG